jgi:hypothetical protein
MQKKSFLIKLSLLLSSLILCFIIAEIGLRVIIFSNVSIFKRQKNPNYYADAYSEDDYWKLQYKLSKKYRKSNAHPVLGWIGKTVSEGNLAHNKTKHVGNRRPVLLYGDSFAQCSTITEREAILLFGQYDKTVCLENFLNNDRNFGKNYYLLNYGVGGYGLDQIYLLFKNSIDNYKNPFVVMSFMTLDLDRSILSVRTGQKPYFFIDKGKLALDEQPITPDPNVFFYNNKIQIKSYLYRRIIYSNIEELFIVNLQKNICLKSLFLI